MPAAFPGAYDALPTTPDSTQVEHGPKWHIPTNEAVIAVQQALGLNPRGQYATVRAWLDALASGAGVANLAASKLTGLIQDAQIQSLDSAKLTGAITTGAVTSLRVTASDWLRAGGGSGNPSWKLQRFSGTLNGAGTARVPHTISQANLRVMFACGGWKGGTGEWRYEWARMIVDGTDFTLEGGAANAPWRGAIIYSEDTVTW